MAHCRAFFDNSVSSGAGQAESDFATLATPEWRPTTFRSHLITSPSSPSPASPNSSPFDNSMSSPKQLDDERPPSPPRGADSEMADSTDPPASKPEPESSPSKRSAEAGEVKEDQPQPERKRKRIDDGKRSARMFGNILGTLRKFQDDEGKTKKSEAAQRRAATQSRIAAKLQTEAVQSSALLAAERELRAVQSALASDTFADRELAASARHELLSVSKVCLSTTLPAPRRGDEALYPHDIIPSATQARGLSALYYLPRVLLPEQEDRLRAQEREVDDLIRREREEIDADREKSKERREAQLAKLRELREKVEDLRRAEKEKHAAAERMEVEA